MVTEQKTIMIVEDDPYIREVMQEVLQSEGYKTITAGNGQEALDYLKSSPQNPALIILDLMMPIKDGFAFRSEQLLDPKISSIPVVVMSADGHSGLKKIKTEALEYLKKPV